MKRSILFFVVALILNLARADETSGRKVYECIYLEDAPYGVLAWSQSEWVKNGERSESRFLDYSSDEAKGLVLDATTQRGVEKDPKVAARETAFYMAYNERGWYLYIHASEPLIDEIMNSMVDPESPARLEGFEIFFAPGLHHVPYYQIFKRTFSGELNFYDWGMPHRHYRSLKSFAKVETLPLDGGFGTFVFVPWEALYDRMPLNGDYWRFSIVRWMPFAKAGGVTWGGQVHDTGNFNLVQFVKPTDGQRAAMEVRILKTAWYKFKALAKEASGFWSDTKLGDPLFHEKALQPVIEEYTALGESLGSPDQWTGETVEASRAFIGDWMEFNYKVDELRGEYLSQKRFEELP